MRRGVVVAGVVSAAVAAGLIALLSTGSGSGPGGAADPDAAPAGAGAPAAALRAAPRGTAPSVERIAVHVKGRVLDRGGSPVPHVKVGARWARAGSNDAESEAATFRRRLVNIEAPSKLVPSYEVQGESDEKGTYDLAIPRSGVYDVEAFPAPPSWCMGTWVTVGESGVAGKTDVRVLAGSALRGRLVDASGRGVVGVVDGSWDVGTDEWWGMDPVVSVPSGEFELPAVPAGVADLTIYLPGHGRLDDVHVRTPRATPLTIVVAGFGGVVKGHVRDSAGRPVAGADVVITVRGRAREDAFAGEHADRPSAGVVRARSEPDGAYRVEDVVLGRVTEVEAAAEGFTFHSSTRPQAPWSGAEVALGVETTIDLTLVRGGTISGRVVEEGSLHPVPKATVILQRVDGSHDWPRLEPLRTVTGDDGTYRVDAAPLGRWIVRGSTAGSYDATMAWARETVDLDSNSGTNSNPPPQESVVVLSREGETVEHTVVLAPGFWVRGRVVGPDGKPVEGVAIRASGGDDVLVYRWGGRWARDAAVATTAADGTFTASGLPPQPAAVLRASKSPFVSTASTPFAIGPGIPTPDLVLTLTSGATVSGVVLDTEGKPVEGVTVQCRWTNDSTYVKSGTDGTFSLDGVGLGAVSINVWGDGWTESGPIAPFVLAADERKEHVEIRVAREARIRGVVVDETGLGIGDVSVSVHVVTSDGSSGWHVSSDDDGTFSVDAVTASRVDFEAESGGVKAAATGITPPAQGVRLVVKRPVSVVLEGRVVDGAGQPLPLCTVQAWKHREAAEADAREAVVAMEAVGGVFRIVVVGVPPFGLRATGAKDASGRPMNLLEEEVTVDDPARGPVTIAMKPGLEIRGRVLDEEGRGVGKAVVRLGFSRDLPPAYRTTTDREGAFEFVALPPREGALVVEPPVPFVAPASLPVTAGTAGVTVRVTAGEALEGRVLGPDGAPHAATVVAHWEMGEGATLTKTTRGDGRFRFEGVPRDATVDLDARQPDERGPGDAYDPDLIDAHASGVRAGTADVVLAFRRGTSISGVVTAEGGRLPSDLVVRATRPGAPVEDLDATEANVAEAGLFRLAPLEPAGSWTVTVFSSSAGELARRANVTAPTEGLRFVVPDPEHVTGRVVGPGDVSQFRVRAWVDGNDPDSTTDIEVDEQGKFECWLPRDRSYRFRASSDADDHVAAVGPLAKGTSVVTLTLVPGSSIAGVVELGTLGREGGWTRVTATSREWSTFGYTTRNGGFVLHGIPPGVYTLTAHRAREPAGGPARLEGVHAGATDVRLRFP